MKKSNWLLLGVGIGLVGITATFLYMLWRKVLRWAHNSLIPWIKSLQLPKLGKIVEDAFLFVDNRMGAAKEAVRSAWNKLRVLLLKQNVTVEKTDKGTFQTKVETWVAEPTDTEVVNHMVQTSEVDWADLPADVKLKIMEKQRHEVNVTKTRDEELAEMTV